MPSLTLHSRVLILVVVAVFASGCFGSTDETTACSVSASSVAMRLESRYALGSTTTLGLSQLFEEPEVTTSDDTVVRVESVQDDVVTLAFVGQGRATVRVTNGADKADAEVEVAPVDSFEIALDDNFADLDSVIPLHRKVVISSSFEVVYYDALGQRLYGRGLEETTWLTTSAGSEYPGSPTFEPGLREVEVRVGHLVSTASFILIHPEEIISLDIIETQLDNGRIRVDGVGRTHIGAAVWNFPTYLEAGHENHFTAFEYEPDPTADPTRVTVSAYVPFVEALESVHEIYRKEDPSTDSIAQATLFTLPSRRSSLPMSGLLSLLGMVVAIRFLTQQRLLR